MSNKANEKKVVTKDFLQKYQQKSFQTISKADFDKLSQAEKDCGITYYIYDKDTTYPENKVVSDKWDAEATYEVGSYCIYEEQLWKCIARNSGVIPIAGSDWKAVSVGNELKTVNESLNKKANIFSYSIYDANTDHNVLDNRLNAIKDAIESIGVDSIKYFSVISIRYYGGIYASYLITKSAYDLIDVFEYSSNLRSIRVYSYNINTKEVTQVKEL